ncbi:putative toxin-antitoxin system toxin component, PIN family [Bacteroides sp. GM023]|uniref:putative toxin-antitoxin system toxin component, PIN family n=1 Tax=Bacteroides sp. GM023 TaxID=2723058 RepID=UPI00168BE97C|nr:putative toxin-antitoxin system toxin component, PIN family [Bacteroides sp. GM023]MBD3589429.1 putative toxin-antitoxin system toxin component, PIN family [Bacteroides sp. GM023]
MKIDNEIKVIVDTNLWISFLIGRKLSCLLSLLSHPNFELVVSQELLDEIREVSSRPKLMKYFSQEQIALLLDFMSEETQSYQLENIMPRCRDPKDDYLLELAIVSKADYLVTGDKDLLDLDKIGSCQIVSAIEFDSLTANWGYPALMHEGLEEYISIIIDSE